MPLERFTFTIDTEKYPEIVAILKALDNRSDELREIVVAYYERREVNTPADGGGSEDIAAALWAIRDVLASGTFTPAPSSNGHKMPPAPEPTGPGICEGCGRDIDPGATLCALCDNDKSVRNLLGVNFEKL